VLAQGGQETRITFRDLLQRRPAFDAREADQTQAARSHDAELGERLVLLRSRLLDLPLITHDDGSVDSLLPRDRSDAARQRAGSL
jgi:hypothetical protein